VLNDPVNLYDPDGATAAVAAISGAVAGAGALVGGVAAGVAGGIGMTIGDLLLPSPAGDAADMLGSNDHLSRAHNDPYAFPLTVNPGRDCNGKCNPCPPPSPVWTHTHADGTTNSHQLIWDQNPDTCVCYSKRIH